MLDSPAATQGATWRTRPRSHWTIGLRRLARHRAAMAGAAVVAAFLLSALVAPHVARYDPTEPHFDSRLRPPAGPFLLGTDSFGRDIVSRLLYGGRTSLSVGVISVVLSFLLGLPLGVAAGYYGGHVDDLIMRTIDVWLAFPGLLLAIGIVGVLGPSLRNVMVAIGIAGVPGVARLVRGSVLSIKQEAYIEVARAVGGRDGHIIRAHVLPNVLAPAVVLLTLRLGTAILTGVGLSFLGLGVQPPAAEWGAMVAEGRAYLQQAWWVSTIPGIAIFLSVMGFNLLGDGLRDALDPRLH
jgi:peptide/nickel transport system permease protein